MMNAIFLNFGYSPWILLLLTAVSVGFVFWSYRRTVPEISPVLKTILISLRILSIIFLLILIFDPKIDSERDKSRRPQLHILIDNSASMSLTDKTGPRSEVLSGLLKSPVTEELDKKFDLRFYSFSDSLREMPDFTPDSLKLNGSLTGITAALTELKSKLDAPNSAVLLFSDGAYNSGSDPAELSALYPCPIFTVGMGDSAARNDIFISVVQTPPLAYPGDDISAEFTVQGFAGASTEVSLLSPEGKIIGKQRLIFDKENSAHSLTFKFKPDTIGVRVYTLKATPVENEVSADNNERRFSLNVLDSRVDILLMAGLPSPDAAFLKRILSANPDYSLTTLIQKKGGGYYQSPIIPNLSAVDLFIFLNYPTRESDAALMNRIFGEIRAGKSLLLIPGGQLQADMLGKIIPYLPVQFARQGKENSVSLQPAASMSPLTSFFPQYIDWNGLPPLNQYIGWIKFRPESSVLLRTQDNRAAAGLISTGGVKSLAFSVHDLWKLSLQDAEHSYSDTLITTFWYNSIRWLASSESEDLFRLETTKPIYTSGENIRFTAHLFDKTYKPLSGADIALKINSPSGELPLDMVSAGNGIYTTASRFYQPGEYTSVGSTAAGKDTLKASCNFIVETYNPEFNFSEQRPGVLRNIASASKGQYYSPSNFENFVSDFTPPPYKQHLKSEIRFFPRMLSLFLLCATLSLEWIIRKRKGMM